MTELAEEVVPVVEVTEEPKKVQLSQEDERTGILHSLAIRLTEMNVETQLGVALPLLEFLEDIEDKTVDDVRKIREQNKFIDLLESNEYRDRLQYEFTDKFNALSTKHLQTYLQNLEYQDAIAEVGIQLVPALEQLQQELLYGVFEKPTLQ